jgi:hypothetical protein
VRYCPWWSSCMGVRLGEGIKGPCSPPQIMRGSAGPQLGSSGRAELIGLMPSAVGGRDFGSLTLVAIAPCCESMRGWW